MTWSSWELSCYDRHAKPGWWLPHALNPLLGVVIMSSKIFPTQGSHWTDTRALNFWKEWKEHILTLNSQSWVEGLFFPHCQKFQIHEIKLWKEDHLALRNIPDWLVWFSGWIARSQFDSWSEICLGWGLNPQWRVRRRQPIIDSPSSVMFLSLPFPSSLKSIKNIFLKKNITDSRASLTRFESSLSSSQQCDWDRLWTNCRPQSHVSTMGKIRVLTSKTSAED